MLAGVVAYALDQPHGSLAAGAVMIAAGAYEFTPVKRHFRRRCPVTPTGANETAFVPRESGGGGGERRAR